jgi:hypothetical protein
MLFASHILETWFMKFDIGICLAVVAISASCSQQPQAPTAPSAARSNDTAATGPDGSTLKFNPPALVTPVEGVRAEDRRPTLVWANATSRYGAAGVEYDLEVYKGDELVYQATAGESPDFGAHLIPFDLEFDTRYRWRGRARIGPDAGPWASFAEFQSPARPITSPVFTPGAGVTQCSAPLSPLGPGENRKPRPNDFAIVKQVAGAFPAAFGHSCQEHYGAAGWEFMDRAIDALRAKDGRYGYNAKRGAMHDPSQDVASYYYGPVTDSIHGRPEVYIFDIIAGHCGPTPAPFWGDVTDITFQSGTLGRTMFPRPGRNVTPTPCAAAAGQ